MAEKQSSSPPKYMQQEEKLSQEFNTFISTRPKQPGFIVSNLYQYQGFWYPPRCLQGTISCQQHFRPLDSDVLLVTPPKSGTTWLKSILFALSNRDRYPIDKNHPLFTTNPHELVLFLEIAIYSVNRNPDFSHFTSPRLFATHMPWIALPEPVRNGSSCKIVYMCRDPKDAFVSLWHFANKLKFEGTGVSSITEAFEMYSRGLSGYGPFWNHILDYWKQSNDNPNRVLFLKYEDMKEQPEVYLRRLAKFLNCPFSVKEEESGLVEEIVKLCSFENLSNLEVNKNGELSYSGEKTNAFFRQGKIGDWKNQLSEEMIQKLDRIIEEKMSASGLELL